MLDNVDSYIYKYNYDSFYLSVSIYYLLMIIYVYVCDLFYCLLTLFVSVWFCNLVRIHRIQMNEWISFRIRKILAFVRETQKELLPFWVI